MIWWRKSIILKGQKSKYIYLILFSSGNKKSFHLKKGGIQNPLIQKNDNDDINFAWKKEGKIKE